MELKSFPKPEGWVPCVRILYGLPVMVTETEIGVPLPIIDKLIADGIIKGDAHGLEGSATAASDSGGGTGDAGVSGTVAGGP